MVCACCRCTEKSSRFRTPDRKRFCHFPANASSVLLLPCPLPPYARICRICYQVARYPATAIVNGVPLQDQDRNIPSPSALLLALSSSSSALSSYTSSVAFPVPDHPPIPADFFRGHRLRTQPQCRQVLLGSPTTYLSIVQEMVWKIVGLDSDSQADGVRLIREDSSTLSQWRDVLTAEQCVTAMEWSESAWLLTAQRGESAVWMNFPVWPRAIETKGREGWVRAMTTKYGGERRTVGENHTHPYQDGEGQWREKQVIQVPAECRNVGWEENVWRAWAMREVLDKLEWPTGMETARSYATGKVCPTFVTWGPSCTTTHIDCVGGFSSMVEGWKVFVWWDMEDNARMGCTADDLTFSVVAAASVPSFHWALIGPGSTISIPADVPHGVVTLTSSLLFTWSHTEAPHSVVRCLGAILNGHVADSIWLYDHKKSTTNREVWLSSRYYVEFLSHILDCYRQLAVDVQNDTS